MTTLTLIRHGQKFNEFGDPALTEIGREQARETGRYLAQFPLPTIISSPLQRTVETAREIADVLDTDFTLHEALVERMNWADPAVSREEFIDEWIKSTQHREYVPRFGDSSLATGRRIQHLVTEVLQQGAHVIFVTHGGAILDYLRNVFGDGSLAKIETQYPRGVDFQMCHCAVNRITFDTPPKLELLNFTNHLTHVSE